MFNLTILILLVELNFINNKLLILSWTTNMLTCINYFNEFCRLRVLYFKGKLFK